MPPRHLAAILAAAAAALPLLASVARATEAAPFGSSVPLDTNGTIAGRENNRRVEFVVNFIIVNDGSK